MKYDAEWLDTHKWMIRSSNNGISYHGFKWNGIGEWTECPDWEPTPQCGHGLHGETPEYNGSGLLYGRAELHEYAGDIVGLDDKGKVTRSRIVATNNDIPREAFERCGYKIATDGQHVECHDGDRWLVLNGTVTLTIDGGSCWFGDDTSCKKNNQSGGWCRFLGDASCDENNQSGGECWFWDQSSCKKNNQSGGECWFYGESKCDKNNQSEG